MNLAFLDTETTGLDPAQHAIWEIAIIRRDLDKRFESRALWHLNPETRYADPKALEIGRYHERHVLHELRPDWEAAYYSEYTYSGGPGEEREVSQVVDSLATMLTGCHLVGAVPSFDDAFLKALFRQFGVRSTWHYHLIDVEALAVGYLCARDGNPPALPWNSDELSRAVGVEPDEKARHTALGDARWARAIFDAVTGESWPEL